MSPPTHKDVYDKIAEHGGTMHFKDLHPFFSKTSYTTAMKRCDELVMKGSLKKTMINGLVSHTITAPFNPSQWPATVHKSYVRTPSPLVTHKPTPRLAPNDIYTPPPKPAAYVTHDWQKKARSLALKIG